MYRGAVWHVVQDQAGGRYHRFSQATQVMIMRMDGKSTVQALWDQACGDSPEAIPTQNEVVELLIQLHAADLLHMDITPDAAALFERYKKRRDQTWKQWLLNPMSLKLPLLDPDRFLCHWSEKLAWLFDWRGALLWLAVVLPAAMLAAQHWSELTGNLSDQLLAAQNVLLMALVFPFVKALHELGHGFATRIWGGRVHEFGVMFLVFAPMPYVDASAASAFASKYRRAVVGAAGMLVEIFLAALALFAWLAMEPGLPRAIAYNVMLIAGISTLIVNGNPLLRYDAYYIFSDLIEMPNLAQRGQKYLAYLCDRYLFRAREAETTEDDAAEKRWLVLYAIASWCYRVFITVSIILFIAGEFFVFGVLLAFWSAITLFVVPIWKALRHVTQSPSLHRRRAQAIRLSLALVTAVLAFLCLIPMPLRTQAEGVIWLPDQALLRAGSNGVFAQWLVAPGTSVTRGTPVLALDDPLLAAELGVAQAKMEEAQARYRIEQFGNPVKAGIARQQLEQERRVLERAAERSAQLIVRAATNGILVAPKPSDMPGQYFKKGELLGYVLDREQLIARVVVTQDNIDLVRSALHATQLRLAENIPGTYPASVIREAPGGVDELPTAALGATGGGTIAVDPKDANGVKTLERVFVFDLRLPDALRPKAFGARVHIRFDHGGEPLAQQAYRRLRQLFLSRFNV